MALFHIHNWENKAARTAVVTSILPFSGKDLHDDHPITLILQVCKNCKDVRTKQIDGAWTLAQINQE